MITLSSGMLNSTIVLNFLHNMDSLKAVPVYVECFMNCRESGLVFTTYNKDTAKRMSFCVYEHRNSDEIIINGKENWSSFNGDLPYLTDSKSKCIASFSHNQHYEASVFLAKQLASFYTDETYEVK